MYFLCITFYIFVLVTCARLSWIQYTQLFSPH